MAPSVARVPGFLGKCSWTAPQGLRGAPYCTEDRWISCLEAPCRMLFLGSVPCLRTPLRGLLGLVQESDADRAQA